jgi:hypothetical protein
VQGRCADGFHLPSLGGLNVLPTIAFTQQS